MNRRALKLLVLLLPLFVARSLLPIGFMLSFEGGAPQMVFCPSVVTTRGTQDAGHAMHMGHGDHGAHHEHGQDSNSADGTHQTCPFAFAGAAPLMAAVAIAAEPQIATPAPAPPDSTLPSVIFRANPIRGPPTLS